MKFKYDWCINLQIKVVEEKSSELRNNFKEIIQNVDERDRQRYMRGKRYRRQK